jgi:hypothetical protein
VQRLIAVARFSEDEAGQAPQGGGTPSAGLQDHEAEQVPAPQEQQPLADSNDIADQQTTDPDTDATQEDVFVPPGTVLHQLVSWSWQGRGMTSLSVRDLPQRTGLSPNGLERMQDIGSRFAPRPLAASEVDRREGSLTLDFLAQPTRDDPTPEPDVNPRPETVFALGRNRWGLRLLLNQDPGEDAPAPRDGQEPERQSQHEPGGGAVSDVADTEHQSNR